MSKTMSPHRFSSLLEVMSEDEQKAFEDRAFAEWMKKVDGAFERTLGASSLDLPDFRYRDMFDEGASPAETVQAWIGAYGDEFGLDPDAEDYE